ncbi:MAG: undecaprenyl-diphosphate phosphatase [Bacteroides sp.]|nr:undecaprenyl-diphosphate phosphatase [Bacteroides sp.]MCM1413626.1 undecaprenyl-diphosphate phosphatase [Bacteroides sp.]MCM1471157.1 undecaprenyl-diphosphate phosphatase [Bacteroides sp.]
MDTIDALIMGVVQGLAEYLPISSSGHLEICREILGLKLPGDEALEFTLMLHVATVLSTIVVLWSEFTGLCKSFFTLKRDENTTYVWKLLLSCIPVGIVGLCFKKEVEQFFGDGLQVVGICLMVTAVLLAFAHFYRLRPSNINGNGRVREHDITWLDALIIGCAQAVAVLPGLSRSGSTIATGLILGDRPAKLAQFSFFMVIIPILGEGLLQVKDLISGEVASTAVGTVPMIVGFLAAFIVGCIACKWMISLVKRGKLVWFAIYCLAMGVVCLLY